MRFIILALALATTACGGSSDYTARCSGQIYKIQDSHGYIMGSGGCLTFYDSWANRKVTVCNCDLVAKEPRAPKPKVAE